NSVTGAIHEPPALLDVLGTGRRVVWAGLPRPPRGGLIPGRGPLRARRHAPSDGSGQRRGPRRDGLRFLPVAGAPGTLAPPATRDALVGPHGGLSPSAFPLPPSPRARYTAPGRGPTDGQPRAAPDPARPVGQRQAPGPRHPARGTLPRSPRAAA